MKMKKPKVWTLNEFLELPKWYLDHLDQQDRPKVAFSEKNPGTKRLMEMAVEELGAEQFNRAVSNLYSGENCSALTRNNKRCRCRPTAWIPPDYHGLCYQHLRKMDRFAKEEMKNEMSNV